jgi:hypothetical protein
MRSLTDLVTSKDAPRNRTGRAIDRATRLLVAIALIAANVVLWGRIASFLFAGGE